MVVSWKLLALLGGCSSSSCIRYGTEDPRDTSFLPDVRKEGGGYSLPWVVAPMECWLLKKNALNIQEGLDSDECIGWKEFLKPELSSPLLVAAGLMLMQQVTGINVVMFYTVSIFESAGPQRHGFNSHCCPLVQSKLSPLCSLASSWTQQAGVFYSSYLELGCLLHVSLLATITTIT